MHKKVFVACLLVLTLHCGLLKCMESIQASCNDDVTLPCQIRTQTDQYRYVMWYKNNIAVIKRKNNDMTFYNKSTSASLGVKEALVLLRVQPYDSGTYQCFLAADIGGKDAESFVTLSVSECPTVGPVLTGTIESKSSCLLDVVEIHALWAVVTFLLICLIKVGICLLTILAFKKIRGCGEGVRKQSCSKYSQRSSLRESK